MSMQSTYDKPGLLGTYGRDGLMQIILIANTVLMLFPIAIMIMSGFKSNIEIFQQPFAIPDFTNVANFVSMATETEFLRYLMNSFVVTGASIFLLLTLGTMAAYAIARYEFWGSSFLLLFFMAGLMVPLKLAIIPLFILFRDMGILNTHWALIAVYTAMGLPSTVFIMTGFIRTLPRELEDAARMDGASEARIMFSVMIPLCRPAMVIAGIYNLVPIWNDFFFPLVFIQNDALKTLPQGMTSFIGEYSTDWGVMFAGLTLAAAPITLVYIILSKQFINGMTAGAVK
ncbi:carbohydrate ABC transporter membrane protein 2, CUT1 family [Pseudooceanicola antarcticus]|uniref:Carbohydrate ABC transporter membrane protein 2, CUT1 family n=1 Tax=Pseudooceanicola antarcticus TaxID=1247613 RepID=A0A285J111_9RHOB|nr:carbohydrate ABC transporter permease [Pseudooceanicola antarcticus]PJE29879.1 carbohydrate ABC transporter permease [Pseudooceanicola antarcticus]SNY54020.1 carbohydrate ABC transporter membrane protein 2, CUT1 family [Pseudooceanicola antarcticus]